MESTDFHQTRKQIAGYLGEVPDPEIPGLSIVDLGMILDIRKTNGYWCIDLAPTYSGCPAIDVIPFMVKAKLEEEGFRDLQIEMVISPPWSTDWISDDGKEKLAAFGIAPPNGAAHLSEDQGKPKQCPQCGADNFKLVSRYGSTPCKAAYTCLTCLEPFEYFKCH